MDVGSSYGDFKNVHDALEKLKKETTTLYMFAIVRGQRTITKRE